MTGKETEADKDQISELVELVEGVKIPRRFLADWRKWRRVPIVTVEQALDLSFGISPLWSGLCQAREPYHERRALTEANIGIGAPSPSCLIRPT